MRPDTDHKCRGRASSQDSADDDAGKYMIGYEHLHTFAGSCWYVNPTRLSEVMPKRQVPLVKLNEGTPARLSL